MAIFDADERPQNYLETLVGEDKKFKSNEELAKGKFEADTYIENLKLELAEARAEATARKRVEELLAQRDSNTNTDKREEAHQPADRTAQTALTQEELVSKIREITAADSKAIQTQRNVEEVAKRVTDHFGSADKANEAVRAKASELGVSVDFLQEVAAKSPKAFYAQMGISNVQAAQSSGPTKSDVNVQGFGSSSSVKPDTYAFFEAQRKANPRLAMDPKFNLAIDEAARRLGDAFFN